MENTPYLYDTLVRVLSQHAHWLDFRHQKRREAPAFMPGMDRRWARRAQCPRAQQDLRSTRALNGRGHCIGGSPGIHAGEDVPVPEGNPSRHLDRLPPRPTRISSTALVRAVQRFEDIQAVGVRELSLAHVPPSRLKTLGRYAASVRAPTIARMPDDRRIATLLAFARTMATTALDDALDLLDLMITDILAKAKKLGQTER